MGSPATKGTARAAISRICTAAKKDKAFSHVTIASTKSVPESFAGSTPATATSDSAVALEAAWLIQELASAPAAVGISLTVATPLASVSNTCTNDRGGRVKTQG